MTGPSTARPPRFPVRPPVTYRCMAGRTPCGLPARLYPGGAYCDGHSPSQEIRAACVQPTTGEVPLAAHGGAS